MTILYHPGLAEAISTTCQKDVEWSHCKNLMIRYIDPVGMFVPLSIWLSMYPATMAYDGTGTNPAAESIELIIRLLQCDNSTTNLAGRINNPESLILLH